MQQGMKWIVENHGSSEEVVTVEVTDKKHQVRDITALSLFILQYLVVVTVPIQYYIDSTSSPVPVDPDACR